MTVTTIFHHGEWEVWLAFDAREENHPPHGLSWIIGLGATREAALDNARIEMARALGVLALQSLQGVTHGEDTPGEAGHAPAVEA